MSIADYFYLLKVDSDAATTLYKCANEKKELVCAILDGDSSAVLEHCEKVAGNSIPERWGVCYDYIWTIDDDVWYLVEQMYNPMISLTGKYALFPGVQLSSFVVDQEKYREIYEYLNQSELRKYYAFLPANMVHTSIHSCADRLSLGARYQSFVEKRGSGMEDWNRNRWQDCHELMRAVPEDMFFRQVMGLHIKFVPESQGFVGQSLENCRRQFEMGADKQPSFLVLGYKYNIEMPPTELVEKVVKVVAEKVGKEIILDLPKFYKYESVTEFEPM